jgi:hypothetical protein
MSVVASVESSVGSFVRLFVLVHDIPFFGARFSTIVALALKSWGSKVATFISIAVVLITEVHRLVSSFATVSAESAEPIRIIRWRPFGSIECMLVRLILLVLLAPHFNSGVLGSKFLLEIVDSEGCAFIDFIFYLFN